jgi:hypothetical protein
LPGHDQIFPNRERGEDTAALGDKTYSQMRNTLGTEAVDRLAEQADISLSWSQEADNR